MKFLVLGHSNSSGKTTTTDYMLHPRVGGELLRLEDFNKTDTVLKVDQQSALNFTPHFMRICAVDAIVVDVGASVVRNVMTGLELHEGALDEIDLFVFVVTPNHKANLDEIAGIARLSAMGVGPERIRVLFNMFDRVNNMTLESGYDALLRYHEDHRTFTLQREATLDKSSIFAYCRHTNMTIQQLATDETDYKAEEAKHKSGSPERLKLAERRAIHALARGVHKRFDYLFDLLVRG